MYGYSLIVLFVLFVVARRIVNSPFGLSLQAIKGNSLRASAIGIAVNWRLVAIYTLSAGYAGIAGALLSQTQAFASLDMLNFDRSADVLLILIIGGTGYLYGGLIGALVFRFLQDYLSELTSRYWQFWLGLLLVAIVIIGRDRIGNWLSPVCAASPNASANGGRAASRPVRRSRLDRDDGARVGDLQSRMMMSPGRNRSQES